MNKPLCSKCGDLHWRFVKCVDAPAANAADIARAVTAEKLKVVPEYRFDRDREPHQFESDNFVNVGGTLWRKNT